MKRTMWIVIGLVAVLSGYLVWRIGFAAPAPGMTGTASAERPRPQLQPRPPQPDANTSAPATSQVSEANEPNRPRPVVAPGDANGLQFPEGLMGAMRRRFDRGGRGGFGGDFGGFGQDRFQVAEANDPNALEALNLNNVQMRDIIERVAAWTGKVVIPVGDAMQQRVTIYSPKRVPRKEAISLIYSALRTQGYMVEDANNVLYIKPITSARTGLVPTIPEDQPLAAIENKDQVVQRFFKLKNYSPADLATLIQPLVGEYGYVSSDLTTNTLLVIDTVANLIRIERIIQELDVPEAGQTYSEIIQLQYGDPVEIVQLLQLLLGGTTTTGTRQTVTSITTTGGGQPGQQRGQFGGPFGRGGPGMRGPMGQTQQTTATLVSIGGSRLPVVLIPEPTRRWIIVRASAQDLKTVKEWVAKLDREDTVKSEYETVQLVYADAQEVASQIDQILAQGGAATSQVRPNVIIRPMTQTKQVVIYGRADLRDMIKGIIAKIDVPPGDYEQRTFQLKYADPDTIKQNLDNLYGQTSTSSALSRYSYGTSSRATMEVVKVTSLPSLGQVTVMASPETMKKIEKQIQEWDTPLDVEKVKPRIIELHNSDPVQMADLLTTLFSEDSTSTTTQALRALIYGGSETTAKGKIVGPLYGQLTFESVPGTRKIIVISKVAEAYDIVEQLIRELDRQEMAEVPRVVTLKYADPEKLAELLNALFSETGTRATITLGATGLSAYSMSSGTSSTSTTAARTTTGGAAAAGGSTGAGGQYTPWWTTARTSTTEQPISNVIGKVRFIPDAHSKSILVLAPPEFQDDIERTIHQLDVPGQQVMVKAVVVEVSHKGATSLGVQLATNPNAFGTLDENALMAVNQLIWLDKGGSPLFNTSTSSTGTTFGTQANALGTANATILTGSINILLDFLVKRVKAKILNQQTLWTKDNEEAMFFKGDNVAFSTGSTVSATVGATQNFEFQRVGMTLRVRPRITPEKNVDMVINVILSDLTNEMVNSQPKRTEMETTTNMIVQNGQTVMLGGILFQKNSQVLRKVALLGDIPILGEAFRHRDFEQSNSEMIIFVTPYVVSEGEGVSPDAMKQIEGPLQTLKDIQQQMEVDTKKLLEPMN
ncbi:MAG: secretin N-terminal domain-containing protein [Sedimentisphaerales bacterium]|nr:secretin N-terminal domain-containing protein [Sedimentisphaerales bacterium]